MNNKVIITVPAVDQQYLSLPPHRRYILVHDATGGVCEGVLGLLAAQGLGDAAGQELFPRYGHAEFYQSSVRERLALIDLPAAEHALVGIAWIRVE